MKGKKYFIDVDGVIRKFTESVKRSETLKNVCMDTWVKLPDEFWVDLDNNTKKYLYECDVFSDVTDFVKNLLKDKNNKIVFLTNQFGVKNREYWTRQFLYKHFGKKIKIVFTKNFQEKLDLLNKFKDFLLVDDYPFFCEKDGFNDVKERIYLVDRIWNNDYKKYYVKSINDIMEK